MIMLVKMNSFLDDSFYNGSAYEQQYATEKNSNVRANCANTTMSMNKTIELKINNALMCPNPQLVPKVRPFLTDVVRR